MPNRQVATQLMSDAVSSGSISTQQLSRLADHASDGLLGSIAHDLFTRKDGPLKEVDDATQCDRVASTAADRWNVTASQIDQPDSLASIITLLEHARDQRLTLRFVGSARSLSNASQPADDGQMVATCRYGDQLAVDTTTLAAGVDVAGLYRAEGGRVLADVLVDLADSDRSLADMGSGDFQSLAGALSTSTHGSGVAHPAFPGLVRSMDVVTYNADNDVIVQRVEPTDGITDPTQFAAWVAEQTAPIELIQDDAIFDAWTVSIGCLGAIYSLTIDAVPTYWLRETRTLEWWSDVQSNMASDLNTVDYYELLLATWPTDNQGTPDFECLVTRRVLVTDPAQQKRTGGRPIAMAIAQTEVGHLATEATSLWAMRNPLSRIETTQHAGVTASEVSPPYTDTSYEILLLRMDINATSSELGVALSSAAGQVDPHNALTAIGTILDMATENQRTMQGLLGDKNPWQHDFDGLLQAWRQAPLHISPIAVRFVAPSSAFVSMQYEQPTCMIEMPMPGADSYDRDLVDPVPDPSRQMQLYQAYNDGRLKIMRDVEQRLIADLGARPHWGQVNDLTWSTTQQIYPKANEWKTVYDNNNHLGVFNNPLTDQLGISRGDA